MGVDAWRMIPQVIHGYTDGGSDLSKDHAEGYRPSFEAPSNQMSPKEGSLSFLPIFHHNFQTGYVLTPNWHINIRFFVL